MATLRNQFGVNITDGQSLLSAEEARAAGMSALRRGYEAGRVGTEMNAALADEAAARAAGDAVAAEAAAQAQQRAGLRQQFYAPEVGRVEDIRGVGDAASWAATQVGQGAASMQDPVALAAAGQGVGTAMRAVPALRGLAAIPAAAGALGAFGINQRQMAGEFYGNLKEDPVALQRMTPQEANQAANLYGVGAGALETVVPAVAGRALGGAALRAGAKVPGVASGTLRAMGTEGLTEVAQGELGRQGVGLINPERDTSGDMSARINEFAGGAVGGAPFGAAGAVADNAYARTANAGERVAEAAGSVIDLADTAAEKTGLKDAAKAVTGKLGEVIDLSLDKGKDVWDRLDEAGGAEGVAKAAKDKLQRLRMSADEASLLSGAMPEDLPPEQASAWMQENDAKRLEVMVPRLAELADAGDERASQILDQIESGDPVAQGQGIDQGAAVLLEQNDYAQAMERAAQFKENFNGFLRSAGSAAGKAAGMAGRGALSAAKGLAEGLAEGAKGKKNLQGVSTLDYDTWKSWRDKNHPTPTSEPGSTHAIQKAVEGRRRLAEQRGQVPVRVNPEQAEASKRRATLFAELIAAEAEAAATRPVAHRVGADGAVDVVNYARSIGFEVADMATWASGRKGTTPTAGKMASFEALTGQIDALAADMRGVLGEQAGEVVQRLLAASDPATQPFLEFLGERVDGWQAGTAARTTSRKDLGIQMAALLPQEAQQELLADGGNAAGQLVSTITQVARGRVPPAQRSALEKALGGPKVLTQLLQMVGDPTAQEADVTQVEEAPSDFDAQEAERSVNAGAGPASYSFARTGLQSARTPTTLRPDPFAPDTKTGKRPALFQPALVDDTAVGGAALEKRLADLAALHEGASGAMRTVAKPLSDVFRDLKYTEEQQMALFRDYLRQEQATPDADQKADVVQAILDGRYKHVVGVGKVRKALQEFAQSRSVAVTEQGTERMPTEITHGALVALGKAGDAAMSKMRADAMQAGPRGSAAYKAALNKAVAEANLLVFKSAEGKNLMGRRTEGDRDIFIPADRLVKWVRARPQDDGQTLKVDEEKPKAAHARYLDDLLSGIQSVMGSGYAASELPSMTDADGKEHSFAERLPPNLRLGLRKVSSFQSDAPIVADLEAAREAAAVEAMFNSDPNAAVGGDARKNPRYQERVAEEQDRDFFTPDTGADDQKAKFKTVVTKSENGKRTTRDQFVPASENEDSQTPLDVTRDERFGNAKTEREDLADRTTKKAADLDAAPGVAAGAPKAQTAPAGGAKRKLSLQGATPQNLDAQLAALLGERGIRVDKAAMEGVPIEMRVSLLARSIQADPTQPMAQDVARFISWLTVGSEFHDRIAAGIAGSKLEADVLAKVNKDARQSMYTPARKQREVVRQAVEMLLTNGLYKKYAAEVPLHARVLQIVREAVRHVVEALGGVKYKELQGVADQYIADLLAGKVKLERERAPGAVLMDPYAAFKADPLAAGIAYALAEGKGFALTGSLAYAAQGTVYRPAGAAIHDLDFVTSMSQQNAERHLERLFPQASKVRSFGGLGDFVSTYVVPPKGHTADAVSQEGGVITGFVVRDSSGAVVGRYTHKDGAETSTGVKATIVDLIGDTRPTTERMTIPTSVGDRSIAISSVQDAMAQKLLYARDKDIRDFANFIPKQRSLNAQRVSDTPATPDADVAKAKEYLERVLGKQIWAEFKDITGYSGEWIENENLLLVSTLTNAGVLNVARHEALHAFFSKFVKAHPKAVRVLSTLTDDPRVVRRLRALLKDEPAALEQLQDGEERLAYIYQFAMAGQLKLPHTPGTTLMHKVRKFLRRVFQMISDQERAVDLLYAFEAGKFNEPSAGARALAKTLDQGTWLRQGSRKFDGVMQRAAAMVMPANTILAESASPTARHMATMFFTNPGEEKAGHGAPGYLNERNQQMRRYDNLFRSAIDQLDDGQMSELMEAMQNETPTDSLSDPDVAEAKEKLHGMFERFHRYMTEEKGLRIGKINENYFPVVWDPAEVAKPEFQEMLRTKYAAQMREMAGSYNDSLEDKTLVITADDVPRMLAERISKTEGLLETQAPFREDGVLRPWFASGERRALNFITPEDRAPFLEKNLVTTLSRYVRQGVRAAEYSSRFGRNGIVLANMLASAQRELKEVAERKLAEGEFKDKDAAEKWASRQYRDVADAAGAMEGTLGNDISTLTRNINSWSIVYQNIRLLPLALFSNFVDPLGIIARGGEAREAFQAFVDGLKGVARGWKDMISDMPADRQKDQWEQLAEHAGVIDGAVFSHLIADEYGSVYLDGKTKRFNELMFKANGMEAWNRAMRVGATRSAVRFIERHSKLPDQHSKRWLAELGLTVKDLPMDDEGRLITSKLVLLDQSPDMSTEQAEQVIGKVHSAIVRWVEGAVLSPNAAQRPAWGSDPHYSMFWHLKQFAYSFHETMIKRALNEAKHGNVMPLGVFSWYIPAIIASDVTKGLMMGGGELPQHLQGHDLGDWVLHGVERSGVLGIGNIAVDAAQDPFGLAGPMTEQIVDIFTGPAEQNIVRALPMNSLYANAVL